MTGNALRVLWIGVLGAGLALPPLVWTAVMPAAPLPDRLSVVSGVAALAALVCAAVVPSRLRSLNRAFGIESVMEVHRFLGVTTAVLVLAHLACVVAADPAAVALLDLSNARRPARAATVAAAALGVLVGAALLRERIRLSYGLWRLIHVVLAGTVVLFSALHVWWLDQGIRQPALFAVFTALVVVVVGVGCYRWVWRMFLDPDTEFVVHEVRAESPSVSTLVLGPVGARHRWEFDPGQFAWLRLRRTVSAEEHPFTIASSAHQDRTEFTIRHNGEFTRTLRALRPGSPVWVDGPHGAFTSDIGTCRGYVLVAGGVGITPMMSMLRTAAHRRDSRPYRLLVVASAEDDLLFRAELAVLGGELDLRVTEVLRRPGPGWGGHTGPLDIAMFTTLLDDLPDPAESDWFLCGPPNLVTGALDIVDALDVAPTRVHTELFDLV